MNIFRKKKHITLTWYSSPRNILNSVLLHLPTPYALPLEGALWRGRAAALLAGRRRSCGALTRRWRATPRHESRGRHESTNQFWYDILIRKDDKILKICRFRKWPDIRTVRSMQQLLWHVHLDVYICRSCFVLFKPTASSSRKRCWKTPRCVTCELRAQIIRSW